MLPRCVVRGRQNPKHLSFSTRFRRARRQSALSLVDLAERAGLAGASVVRYLETGMRAPRLDTVERLAHGLGLSPAFLAFDLGADTSLPADGLRCEGIASRLRETRTVCGLTMRALARAAGLTDIVLKPKPEYVAAMTSFEDPLYQKIVAQLPPGTKPSDYIVSLEVRARKPGADCCGNDCCKS